MFCGYTQQTNKSFGKCAQALLKRLAMYVNTAGVDWGPLGKLMGDGIFHGGKLGNFL
jgi:hypothetical protein